ncbi:MAG: extracellular solute-binding protein [Desulfurococcaceae archaeon]
MYKQAVTKTTAIVLVVAVAIAAVGLGLLLFTMQQPAPTSTPTPPPSEVSQITIGDVKIRVPKEFAEFVEKAKRGEISVTIYFGFPHAPEEKVGFDKVIEMFKREYPGIDVRVLEYAGMGEMQTKIMSIASLPQDTREKMIGQAPDVFSWAHDWIGWFAESGYILPLEDYIGYDAVEDISEHLLSIAMAAVTYKAKTYGLPYAGEALALFVNLRMVDKPPESFSEMLETMRRYYNPDAGTYGVSMIVAGVYHTTAWVTAFRGFYYDDVTKELGLLLPGTSEGLKFFVRNILRYMDVADLGHYYQRELFGRGRTPFYVSGPWDVRYAIESLGIDGFTVVPLPPIDGRIPRPFSGFRNLYLSVMAGHGGLERTYAAVLFILYFALHDEAVLTLVRELGYVPVKPTVADYISRNPDEHPLFRIVLGFYRQIERSVPMPKDENMQVVWGADRYIGLIWEAYTKALAEGRTVDEAVELAVGKVDEALRGAYDEIAPRIKK